MDNVLSISPEEPLVGTPITTVLEMHNLSSPPSQLVVSKIDGKVKKIFQITLGPENHGRSIAQFALYEAGLYQVEVGNLQIPLRVQELHNVPFFAEITFLGGSVCLLLGGLILWNKKRKNRM